MEQIRAEQCRSACMARKPIVHRRYSCHRGSKGLKREPIPMKPMEFFPAAKACGVSLSDFSGARHAAKGAIPSSLPLHVQRTESSAMAWGHSHLSISLSHSGTSWRAEPRAGNSIPKEESAGSFISRLASWKQGCQLGLQNNPVVRTQINVHNAVGWE